MWKYKTDVSEELKQGGFDIALQSDFHYIKVGSTTVSQLSKAGVLPKKTYGILSRNKPDGLVLHGKNTVVALVEYKKTGKINSEADALHFISEWYYTLADKIGCKVLCASDGSNTYWIYAPTREFIKEENGAVLRTVLNVSILYTGASLEVKQDLVNLFKKFDTLDDDATFKEETFLNPQKLARSVWQKIWISTGKEPEKCLYNVVEIFIFKFLSDLDVLTDDYRFSKIYKKSLKNKNEALNDYARVVRPKIRDMFPSSPLDGTTVINGTIFVNEQGEPNLTQATLFQTVLREFANYDKEYGSFRNIDKNFKTRLYESFLRQSAGVAAMGQYFTPRNVVRAIVRMVNTDSLSNNATIGDPFCGVGGFLLELLNEYPALKQQYEPHNGEISPSITLLGFDKGSDEKEDQRTVILAKANMLIYFSDLLVRHKDLTHKFARNVFNQVFRLIKSNLGTLGEADYANRFDLILTNPPYVTSGVKTIKQEIDHEGLDHIYSAGGTGLEGLGIEWIMHSLKPGGTALVVVPDGLLSRRNDMKLRHKIIDVCRINAIISLPSRTFYATPKKTYILSLTKKAENDRSEQTTPIFTYLVSEIGETRDSKRFEIMQNDLTEMVKLYRQFMASPHDFDSRSPRCRTQLIDRFKNGLHWLVDKDWSEEEKKELGILEEATEISEEDFYKSITDLSVDFSDGVEHSKGEFEYKTQDEELGSLGHFIKGNSRYTAKYCYEHAGNYPVYSADTKGQLVIGRIDSYDYDMECLRITTNGAYAGTVTYLPKQKFSINGDAGIFVLDRPDIDYRYLSYVLTNIRTQYGYGWENKPKWEEDLEMITIPIPINSDGSYNIEIQRQLAQRYQLIETKRKEAMDLLKRLTNAQIKISEKAH